jgi:hypothetical protein
MIRRHLKLRRRQTLGIKSLTLAPPSFEMKSAFGSKLPSAEVRINQRLTDFQRRTPKIKTQKSPSATHVLKC